MVYLMVETLGCAWDEAQADKKAISLAAETAVMLDRLMVAPLALAMFIILSDELPAPV